MTEQEKRAHRCAFTGHRPEKLTIPESAVREMLEREITNAVSDGFNVFISGASRGVDLWAADIVLRLRESNPSVKLICAVPFEDFDARWTEADRREYARIITAADLMRYICPHYSTDCFQRRNEWMIDHAARVIAVWNGKPSGTGNTVVYAQGQGVQVVNVLDDAEQTDL